MSGFADRLREEIERIGISKIANQTGVARNTVYNWMANANVPLNSLMALYGLGLDVVYVITGQRSANAPLPADESLLLDGYRASSPETRKAALRVLLGGDLPAPAKTKTKTIKVTGDGNQAAGRDLIHQQGVEIEGSKPADRRKR